MAGEGGGGGISAVAISLRCVCIWSRIGIRVHNSRICTCIRRGGTLGGWGGGGAR